MKLIPNFKTTGFILASEYSYFTEYPGALALQHFADPCYENITSLQYSLRKHLTEAKHPKTYEKFANGYRMFTSRDIKQKLNDLQQKFYGHPLPPQADVDSALDFLEANIDNIHTKAEIVFPKGALFVVEKLNYTRFKANACFVQFNIKVEGKPAIKSNFSFEEVEKLDLTEVKIQDEPKETKAKRKKSNIKI